MPELKGTSEKAAILKLSELADAIDAETDKLQKTLDALKSISDVTAEADAIRDEVIPQMAALRKVCDDAETRTAEKFWPFPTYSDLLFGVR